MIVNKKSLINIKLLTDLILLNLSYFLAAALAQPLYMFFERNYLFVLLLILNLLWYFSCKINGFYEDFTIRYFSNYFINIIKNVLVQVIASILFIFFVKEGYFTRNFIIFYSLLLSVSVSIRVVAFKFALYKIRSKGKGIREVLLIGKSDLNSSIIYLFDKNPDFGYKIVDTFKDFSSLEAKAQQKALEDLEQKLSKSNITDVIIADTSINNKLLNKIIDICDRNAKRTHIIPSFYEFLSKKFHFSLIGNIPFISVRVEPLAEIQWRIIKRAFDLIVSILTLIFLASWLFPIIILLIKLDSKGPVFFVQQRVGQNGKLFRCYKFRTMYQNSEPKKGFIPATKEDPRITKVGKFLRRSNLDELPQIFNVIKGEMSLVGPRPHALSYEETYKQFFEKIKLRRIVKPGITGWAQIHGLRGDVKDPELNKLRTIQRIEHDIWYIENWSFGLDIQIILTTIWQMIKGNTRGV